MTKDSQIRTLRDEIAHQEDLITKLGKYKYPLQKVDKKLKRVFKLWKLSAIT